MEVLRTRVTFALRGRATTTALGRALALLGAERDRDGQAALIRTLPVGDQLLVFEALDPIIGAGSRPEATDAQMIFESGSMTLLKRLRSEGRDWAPRVADEILANKAVGTVSPSTKWLVFLSFARVPIKIEKRWDVLLPLGFGVYDKPCAECIRALPEARRTPAIVRALDGHRDLTPLGVSLLRNFPSAELARLLVKERAWAPEVKDALAASAKTNADVARVMRKKKR